MKKPTKIKKEVAELIQEEKLEIEKEVVQKVSQQLYSGPIPSPDALAKYEEILPGAADRIIRMAEKEQDERWKSEKQFQIDNKDTSDKELTTFKRGQVFGLIAVLAVFSLCFFLVSMGSSKIAGTLAGAITVALAGAFVYKNNKSKD